MCCIIACRDIRPSKEIIERIHSHNSHGIGLIWFNKDGVAEYKKWLYPFEVEKIINDIPLPFIMHFREASVGMGRDNTLNHPFVVSEDSPLALAGVADKLLVHNGTVKDFQKLLDKTKIKSKPGEPMSDSRAIAMILGKYNKDNQQEKLLKKIVDSHKKGTQRFVLIDSIIKKFKVFGEFTFENGCFYSNMAWKKNTSHWLGQYDDYMDGPVSIPVNPPKQIEDKKLDLRLTQPLEINYDIPEVSPLYLQMKLRDRKKYLDRVKMQDFLNGVRKIKINDENILCGFCGESLPQDRVTRLKILGYLPDEMNCLKCMKEMNIQNYIPRSVQYCMNGS